MYHYELRKFPHTFCVFNQSEQQLRAIIGPWTSGEWVEVGERTWNIHETKLTILEGPELSLPELAMNRGWRNARRRSDDITERVLGATQPKSARSGVARPSVEGVARREGARSAAAAAAGLDAARPGRRGAGQELELLADSLGLEVLSLLDSAPVDVSQLWRLAQSRLPERPVAESLALAEQSIRSLLARRLVTLRRGGEALGEEHVEHALRDIASWSGGEQRALSIVRVG
jgi:hypothetical protein